MLEGPDEYTLPITEEGVVRIVPRIREMYLTRQIDDAVVQAVGRELQIKIWSSRTNIIISLPFDGYRAERPFKRSVNSWGVNVNRWLTPGKHSNDESADSPFEDSSLKVGYGSDSRKRTVEATVETFRAVKPDV